MLASGELVWGGDNKNAIKSDIEGHQRCLDNPGCRRGEQEEFRQQLHTTGLVDMFDYQDPDAPMPENERLAWFFREKDRKWNRGLRLDSVHVTPSLLDGTNEADVTVHSLRHLHFIKGTDHVPIRLHMFKGRPELNVPQVCCGHAGPSPW